MSVRLAKLTWLLRWRGFVYFISFYFVNVLLCKYSLKNLGNYKREICKHPFLSTFLSLPCLGTACEDWPGMLWECCTWLRSRIALLPAFKDERCLAILNTLVNRSSTPSKQFAPYPAPCTLLLSKSNEGWVSLAFLPAFSFFGDPRLTQKKIKPPPKGGRYLFLWSKSSHAAKQSLPPY